MANEEQKLAICKLESIMEIFSKIIGMNQMDLANFLSDESDKYYSYFYYKIILFISFNIIITITALIDIFIAKLPFILDVILTLIYFIPIIISLTIAYLSIEEFNYSIRFYHDQVKYMFDSYIQLQLILNSHALSKALGNMRFDDYKKNLKEIKDKIDFGSEIVPPFFHSLKQLGIITVFFSILSSGFKLIYEIFSNSQDEIYVIKIVTIENIIDLLLIGIVIIIFLGLFWHIENEILKEIKKKKKIFGMGKKKIKIKD